MRVAPLFLMPETKTGTSHQILLNVEVDNITGDAALDSSLTFTAGRDSFLRLILSRPSYSLFKETGKV